MRIIHVCACYPPAEGPMPFFVKAIVENTRDIRQGRDVRVLTSTLEKITPLSELHPDRLLNDPIYVQRLHYAKLPFMLSPHLQALSYYLGHHKPDIIHAYGTTVSSFVAARYAKKHAIPYIIHPIQQHLSGIQKRFFHDAAAVIPIPLNPSAAQVRNITKNLASLYHRERNQDEQT